MAQMKCGSAFSNLSHSAAAQGTCEQECRQTLKALQLQHLPRCTSTPLFFFKHTRWCWCSGSSLNLVKSRAGKGWGGSAALSCVPPLLVSWGVEVLVALASGQAHLESSRPLHYPDVKIWSEMAAPPSPSPCSMLEYAASLFYKHKILLLFIFCIFYHWRFVSKIHIY